MARFLIDRQFELREWQGEAFRKVEEYFAQGKKDFLCVATPGSGKTKFALRVAYEFFRKKRISRLVVVTPSIHLTKQWAAESAIFAGIDIPRLRVGVYFTIVKAELFFRQAVGRFVRVQKELKEQEAYFFIPQDKEIVKLAETIQEEREHALDKADKTAKNGGGDVDLWGNYIPAIKGKFEAIGSEATDSKTIAVAIEITNGARFGIDYRKVEEQNPVYLQREIIKKRLNELAKKYALRLTNGNRNIRPDFKALHRIYIEQGGKPMDSETLEELRKREQFYISLLRSN